MEADSAEILKRRSLLFSARVKLAPEIQPVKDTAIDKILEQNLLIADCDAGLNVEQLHTLISTSIPDTAPLFTRVDIDRALARLLASDRVRLVSALNTYRLSPQALKELWVLQEQSEARLKRILAKLFRNSDTDPATFGFPLIKCLSFIFSRLGEAYVRLLKGEVAADELLTLPSIGQAIDQILSEYVTLNRDVFSNAITTFFRDADPDFDAVKWNMGQNYYLAKALGLDPGGYLLSKEVFKNSSLYLDTNALIHALAPGTKYHGSFKALSTACQAIGVTLSVCQITLNELAAVIVTKRAHLEKVVGQIPETTKKKIPDVFYELYREAERKGPVDLDVLLADFSKPVAALAKYGVVIDDDEWFDKAKDEQETITLAEKLAESFLNRRGWRKGKMPSLHDALLMRWVLQQRGGRATGSWLVTRDTTLLPQLPGMTEDTCRPIPVPLDAVLQWISPIAINEDHEDEAARVFSEAVKYQLLPQDSFFDLRDFLVFAEMEWSCKELPAEDVENCIRYIRTQAPHLDPTDPLERQQIAREISKFFADPGRKYRKEVSRLEGELEGVRQEAAKDQEKRNTELREKEELIARLKKQDAERKEEIRVNGLKSSARGRFLLTCIVWLCIATIILFSIVSYGEGATPFQKLAKSWPLCLGAVSLFPIIGALIIGKERFSHLGWGAQKVLGKKD